MLYSAVVAPQLQQVPSGIGSRGRRFSVLVTVRFFAGMRERAGSGATALDVRDGATVDEVVAEVVRTVRGGQALPSRVMKAVNGEYVKGNALLREGDELALIPPVSGGVAQPLFLGPSANVSG